MGRDTGRRLLDSHIFVVFNICDASGNGYHWTLAHCHISRRTITYLDYWQKYHARDQHLAALRALMQYVSALPDSGLGSSEDWLLIPEGNITMPVQVNAYDCGPSVCLMAQATVEGISLSALSNHTVTESRPHIAAALLTHRAIPLRQYLAATSRRAPPCPRVDTPPPSDLSRDIASLPGLLATDYHPCFEMDCFKVDEYERKIHDSLDIVITLPSVTASDRLLILQSCQRATVVMGTPSQTSISGRELQDLVAPDCITTVLLDYLLLRTLSHREDVVLVPTDITSVLLLHGHSPDHLEPHAHLITDIRSRLLSAKWVLFAMYQSAHFMAVIAECDQSWHYPTRLSYIDSLKWNGTFAVRAAKQFLVEELRLLMIYPQWHTCELRLQASIDMITQQRLLLPGPCPSAVQMDCGIYTVLMSYLTIHCLPLSLLTPNLVHLARTHLALLVIQPALLFMLRVCPKSARPLPSEGEETKSDSAVSAVRQHLRRSCVKPPQPTGVPLPEGRTVYDINTQDPAQLRTCCDITHSWGRLGSICSMSDRPEQSA